MQLELKRIQHELRTTFVYVTHDQEEALSMSDRIAVMNDGLIEQLGVPREVYDHPATPFVADFVGVLNALELRVDEVRDGHAVMRVSDRERVVVPSGDGIAAGASVLVAVRPERVRVHVPGDDDAAASAEGSKLAGTIAQVVYLGTLTQFHVDTSIGKRLVAHRLSDDRFATVGDGDRVTLEWDPDDASILRHD
jgi:spermidine/putrescine transport system ATP-binding protein